MPRNQLYSRPASGRHCRALSPVLFGCLLLAGPSLYAEDPILAARADLSLGDRAVREPAHLNRDFVLSSTISSVIDIRFIVGGPDFQLEVAKDYELGYRASPGDYVSFSATLFQTRYDRLRSGQTPSNAMLQNEIDGIVNGLEGRSTVGNSFDNAHPEWPGDEDDPLNVGERAAFPEPV